MKNYIIYTFSFLIINFGFGQVIDNDYYQMYKGGKKYLKPVKYVLFNQINNQFYKENGKLVFFIKSQKFIHNPKNQLFETLSNTDLKDINFNTVADLISEEYLIYKKRSNEIFMETNFKPPASLSHNYFKILIVERINHKKSSVYEVYWQYSIQ